MSLPEFSLSAQVKFQIVFVKAKPFANVVPQKLCGTGRPDESPEWFDSPGLTIALRSRRQQVRRTSYTQLSGAHPYISQQLPARALQNVPAIGHLPRFDSQTGHSLLEQ